MENMVLDTDSLGRPLKAERIGYKLNPQPDGRFELLEIPTGAFVSYSYRDDNDLIGSRPAY